MVDPGEGCDDGNEIDADGCNRDCTVSGSVLWTLELPGVSVTHIAVDAMDQLHVLGLRDDDGIEHVVVDPDGTQLSQETLDVPVDAPEGTTDVDRGLHGFGLTPDGGLVYSLSDAYFGDAGLLDARFQVRSEDPTWSQVWGLDGTRVFIGVADDGGVFGMGETFYAFGNDGSVVATGPGTNARIVLPDPQGVAMVGREIAFYTPQGEVLWTTDWPSGVLTGIVAAERMPGGDVVVLGEAGEDILRARQIRLARYEPGGTEVSSWMWPETPGDAGPGYHALAVTPEAHIAFAGGQGDETFLWKLDEDYETRWRVALPHIVFPEALVSDSAGALLFLSGGIVGKFAP